MRRQIICQSILLYPAASPPLSQLLQSRPFLIDTSVRPFLVDQNNCCIIRLHPVRLLDDVELYHVSVVGISLVLAISLVLVDYGV
jgi:hypothetical protein